MKKSTKILIGVAVVFAILIISATIFLIDLLSDVDTMMEQIYEPVERTKSEHPRRAEPIQIKKKVEPISVLLVGLDQHPGQTVRSRSDTLMVLTLNPEEESMKILSIPRDTRTTIVGRGFEDKINHAHAFGGVGMTMDTVEEFLDIPIDYYISINFEGFISVVDILGGVTVDVNMNFDDGGYSFREGPTRMDGSQALAYSRMRYQDPLGDFGRNIRQQQIIMGMIQEGKAINTLFKLDQILKEIPEHVRTNIKPDEMDQLRKRYLPATNNQESLKVNGQGQYINNIYYYVVPEAERAQLSDTLKQHLNLK